MKPQVSVVVHGSPLDGLTIVGPFADPFDAAEWAEAFVDGEWWVAPLGQAGRQAPTAGRQARLAGQ